MTSISSRRKQSKPQRLPEDEEDDVIKGSTVDQISLFLSHTSPTSPPPMDLTTKRNPVLSPLLDGKQMHSMLFDRNTAQLLHQMLSQLNPLNGVIDGVQSEGVLPDTPAVTSTPPLTESRADSGLAAYTCAARHCGKAFCSLGALCWHVQDSHSSSEEQLIECEHCAGRFSNRNEYTAHRCTDTMRPSSVSQLTDTDEDDERRSVPAKIRTDFHIVDNGESMMDFEDGKEYSSGGSREATIEPSPQKSLSLLSQLFPNRPDGGPIDLSTASPAELLNTQLPIPPHAFSSHMNHPFFGRQASNPEMVMTPTGRVPVDNFLQNEDDWESLMEISNTDESEKIRALVGDKPIPTTDPNQCLLCRRVLSCKSALQMHYRTHTGERPFKCKICQRAFTTKGNLKTHMGVHRSKHPFRSSDMGSSPGMIPNLPQQQCPICQKRFVTVPQLQAHIAEHTQRLTPPTFHQPQQSNGNTEGHPNGSHLPGFPSGLPFPLFLAAQQHQQQQQQQQQQQEQQQQQQHQNGLPQPQPGFASFMQQLLHAQQSMHGSMMGRDEREEEEEEEEEDGMDEDEMESLSPKHESPSPSITNAPILERQPTVTIESLLKPVIMEAPIVNSISPSASSDGSTGLHDQTDGSSMSHSSDSEEQKAGQSIGGGVSSAVTVSIKDEIVRPSDDGNEKPSENPLDAMKKMWAETEPPPPRAMPPLSKHQCGVCYKHFSSSSALQIHMRTHTGDKPFKCEVCARAFTTRGNLKVHMSTHMTLHTPSRRGRRIFDGALEIGYDLPSGNPLPLPTPGNIQLPPQIAAQIQAMSGNLLPPPGLPMQMLMQLMSQNLESIKPNCIICQKSFGNVSELSEHMREHSSAISSAMANNNLDLKTES